MKTATLAEIKKELKHLSDSELIEICLRLIRFKKENKELLSYLLFESFDEASYVESVKKYMDNEFELINRASFFYIRKSVRKILRNVKKYIRYSPKKETEVELLLYFCKKLQTFKPSISRSTQLTNMYKRQLDLAKKNIEKLHEDLQYDYKVIIEQIES